MLNQNNTLGLVWRMEGLKEVENVAEGGWGEN